MSTSAIPTGHSPLSDFVLAHGNGARAWLAGKRGFRMPNSTSDAFALALRGDLEPRRTDDGRFWLAQADLIAGDLAGGANACASASPPQATWRGRFAMLLWDERDAAVHALTDHFASLPIYVYEAPGFIALASDFRLLLDAPGCRRDIDHAAVFHYLNFSCIPAPHTLCTQIRGLNPGSRLSRLDARVTQSRYVVPTYREDLSASDAVLSDELRGQIVTSVRDFRPAGDHGWGCFLSGGTDSSSIVSILKQQAPDRPVHSYSIGFAEAGYDELGYARIAADACGAVARFDSVDRDRAQRMLDAMVDAYAQPFGNASALPTLACAQLAAADGAHCLLAGDGGDEIFGGNERYAKDQVMAAFYRLPSAAKALARWGSGLLAGGNSHLLNRVHNFTRRASLPNPDRFYSDDAFASECYEELLTPAFRDAVGRNASLEFMRELYDEGDAIGELHRIMRLDLAMAIARNDLVKVHGACKAQNIAVRFPYLDTALVDFTGRLPARHKVRGLRKRYLFKRAMQGILPEAILRKRKQGFGLPIAVWLREDVALQARVSDVLNDRRTRERGLLQPEFADCLMRRHRAGAWDHAAQLWQMLVLELWLRRHFDAR